MVILACVAFLAWRFRPLGPIERTLSPLPAGLAVEAYVAPAALERMSGRLDALELDFADPAAALALGLGARQVYAVATGEFDVDVLRTELANAGLTCLERFPTAPCVGPRKRDWLSVALLDDELLGVSYGVEREGVRRLMEAGPIDGANLERVRAAVRSGALLWAAVRSGPLDRIMASPPEGWINLTLAARALRNAPVAYLTLTPDPLANALRLELEAPCPGEPEAAELRGILDELNRFAAKIAENQRAEQWLPLLESFELDQRGTVVGAAWSLSERDIARLANAR